VNNYQKIKSAEAERTKKMLEKLVPGAWVLMESIISSRNFSMPSEVTKVSGKRVYVRRPHRDKSVTIEDYTDGYKAIASVRLVVTSEKIAHAIYEADVRISEDKERQYAKINKEANQLLQEQIPYIIANN
jgi:hypothetical protein